MDELSHFSDRPLSFLARYFRRWRWSHLFILTAVTAAVICSVSTQYGVKFLVDTLAHGPAGANRLWEAFAFLVLLIGLDNLLWRLASWVANSTFVAVTGDVRRDLFRHLTGHAPSYFADRLPGMLASRITATSNALFTVENMFMWNVLPPCIATFCAIAFVATVSPLIAAGLSFMAGILVFIMFRLAAAGTPLHHDFADKAAVVDGEIVDVINNLPLVRAFGGLHREYRRFDQTVDQEMTARRRSLYYLEKIRLFHAIVTVLLIIGLLAWAIVLWGRGAATTGDVVLLCTLGLSILHATRDLAVALVDVTQHMARLSEALKTLLVPHELRDHPKATPLVRSGASVVFENVSFTYPDGRRVFRDLSLRLEPGQRVGLVGPSGSGKSTLFSLLQRFYDLHTGRILIDDQDIALVTQESLREAIAVVPQDISLFHRSIMENVRYGKPESSDQEVFEAAVAARCTHFIDALPSGIATVVGDRGVKLSGGQRQRVAIARAFLKNAPILLLDEATSALDSESEEEIRAALDRLMFGRTVIAIAHRLSTLRNFDRIIVLRGGKIVQDGAPDKLMRHDGLYRELIKREMMRLAKQAA
ncbi:MAG TPA: ABC transporter ATP-binding protein [Xanthobacteraceae bacterium]|jgi:ATP-binding cassette subfamily B protein|nr:ABC transporter ATP-binding protein [Xanthobacteraceae bacterium]